MKGVIAFCTLLFLCTSLFSQDITKTAKFQGDLIMGPFLFVDHIPYDAVLMKGARLAYMGPSGVSLGAAYMVGQQADETGNLGLTHFASVEIQFYLKPAETKYRPYFMLGSGFLEFKSFAKDKYGIANQAALGTEFSINPQLGAVLEAQYLNLAAMKLGGVHELVVAWGLRTRF